MGQYKLGDAIRQFLAQSRIKGGIQALQIEEVWEQIMGKTVASKVFFADKPLQHMQVRDFMTTTVPIASHDIPVDSALQQLENHGTNYLAIYDHMMFLGIVNVQDLMHTILQKNKAPSHEMYH